MTILASGRAGIYRFAWKAGGPGACRAEQRPLADADSENSLLFFLWARAEKAECLRRLRFQGLRGLKNANVQCPLQNFDFRTSEEENRGFETVCEALAYI
jgi:hypothetical protein